MKAAVSAGIEELKRQFSTASFTVREDGEGGAYVLLDAMDLGTKLKPSKTWMGFQITAQYPYADIYPVFIGAEVERADKKPFEAPITRGHKFEGRDAIQVSRRNNALQGGVQKATAKILKILDFLESLS